MNDEYTENNRLWISGDTIPELAFRFNSVVAATDIGGEKVVGWIVGADIVDGVATYTVESRDGAGDFTCSEKEMRYYDEKGN